MVPKAIHQIWIGPDPLPRDQARYVKGWKRKHRDWEHRLWTEENLPQDPIRPEIHERLRAPVERADILRLEILYRYGGVYLDTDLECLRPLDEVIGDEEFVGVLLKPGRMTNTLLASVPGHPLLERALRELRPTDMYWTPSSGDSIKEVAGPPFLRRLVRDYPEVRLLEPPLLFPSTPEERERAVAVHHMARTWHNATTLRTAMLIAEQRVEETRAQLRRDERRHAATRRRLERLERRRERRRPDKGGIWERLGLPRRSG